MDSISVILCPLPDITYFQAVPLSTYKWEEGQVGFIGYRMKLAGMVVHM